MTSEKKTSRLAGNVGVFALFLAVGAVLGLGFRALLGGGDHAVHAEEQKTGDEHAGHAMQHAEEMEEKTPMAMGEHDPAAMERKGLVLDLGNEKCPVMGGDVDGKTFTIWNGLRIGHCCAGCTDTLLEDPEKVLDEAGIEWREAAKLVESARAAEGAERQKLLAEIEKRFEIVSRPADGKAESESVAGKGFLVDLGNGQCPVMGDKVDGKTYTVWNHLRIGHCCPGCTDRLLADPEKVLDEAGIEWREAAKTANRLMNAEGEVAKKLLADVREDREVELVDRGPLVLLGNEKCPVMGGEVDGKTFTVWNGLKIGHCCPGCTDALLANPEKVLDEAGIEWRKPARLLWQARNAKGEESEELLEKIEEDWKLAK